MWTRTDLKRNAKSVLKKNYWKSVIVSLIFLFITGQVQQYRKRGI